MIDGWVDGWMIRMVLMIPISYGNGRRQRENDTMMGRRTLYGAWCPWHDLVVSSPFETQRVELR